MLVQPSVPESKGELPPFPLPEAEGVGLLAEVEVEGTLIPEVEAAGIAATLAPDHLEVRSCGLSCMMLCLIGEEEKEGR